MERALQLTVVVPAFNEEANLATCAGALLQALRELGTTAELIVVDDGSRDGTGAIADRFAAEHPAATVIHQANAGIGGAFRTGLGSARGAYVLLWPADMIAQTDDLRPYLDALGQADVIVGCRRARLGYNPLMRFNAWLYPRLVAALFGLRLRDVNWICLYRTAALRRVRLTQAGIPLLTEMLVRLRDAGATFREVEVAMRPRATGTPSAARFRVMRRTLTGLFALWWTWRREPRAPQPTS